MENKPCDLDDWVALVEKNQWFMVWEQNWSELFLWHPEYILRWPKERLRAEHWLVALRMKPELAEQCDFASLDYRLLSHERFWGMLLEKQPCLADKCEWRNLDDTSIESILNVHPELIEFVPQDIRTGGIWLRALLWDGKNAAECDWDKLSEWDWMSLLREHPKYYAYYHPNEETNWGALAEYGIDVSATCPVETLKGRQLQVLLSVCPDLAGRCDWTTLSSYDWSELLRAQPRFADHCDFDKFSGCDWANLLATHPKFADRCDWDKLSGEDWRQLLDSRPEFTYRCDWEKLTPELWVMLMVRRPELGRYCEIWDQFSFVHWQGVIKYHGDYAWRCPVRMRKGIDARPWFWEAADAWHAAQESTE